MTLIHRYSARLWRSVSGAAAIELSLVAPVLILALFGLFEVGHGYYSGAAVRNAVQRASRALLIDPSMSGSALQNDVQAMLVNVPVNDLSVTVTAEAMDAGVSARRVAWTYSYPIAIPFTDPKHMVFSSSMLLPISAP